METQLEPVPPFRRTSGGDFPTSHLTAKDRWIAACLSALALALYLFRLGSPGEIIPLDEQHYVPDARQVLDHGSETHFVVHPPLGKQFIALGMKMFGRESAFGWRFWGAVLGALAIGAMYLIGRRLWTRRRTAVFAALLLLVDGLWFVQARTAMLDVYAAAFIVIAFWLLLEHRARDGSRAWLYASGAAAGLAFASKWAAAPILVALAWLSLWWAFLRRREARLAPPGDEETAEDPLAEPVSAPEPAAVSAPVPAAVSAPVPAARSLGRVAIAFVAIPAAIYLVTYSPWFVNSTRYKPPLCVEKGVAAAWVCYQREIFNFHRNLGQYTDEGKPAHPYFSDAWTWPFIGRPVAHYYDSRGTGAAEQNAEVLGLPNPVVWWSGFLALIPLTWWGLRRGDRTARLLAAMTALFWVPYLPAAALDRPTFLFYALPMLPFLVLGLAHTLERLSPAPGGLRGRIAPAFVALSIAAFAYFYPVLAGVRIPRDGVFGWRSHIWYTQDCTSEQIKVLCWI